ncbi:TRAP transporter substrate-binding protein [Pusillimonas sp.]|uniref:TRAP transporter substrate-binding protein n=1 Tax=Pusillimonas sp. TaxID=3040095 RepID=UPI0037C7CC5A
MFTIKKWLSLATLAIGGALGPNAPVLATTELTVSSWLPPGYFFMSRVLRPWAESVERETEGRVKVVILPAALGRPAAAFDVVRQGQADISYGVHGYQPGRFELSKAVELPFTGNHGEAVAAAYWRIYKKYFEQAGEHRGVQVLSVYTHTPGHIFHTMRPMTTMEDLQGQKMRVSGGIVNEVAQALGFSPLMQPASEVYQVLANRVADGVLFTNDSIEGFKLSSVIAHSTQIPGGLYNTSFFFIMNEEKFRGLTKEDQDTIMRLSGENYARMAGRSFDEMAANAFEHMEGHNIEVQTASDGLLDAIRERTSPVEASWVEQAEKRGVDGRKALDELRSIAMEISAEIESRKP